MWETEEMGRRDRCSGGVRTSCAANEQRCDVERAFLRGGDGQRAEGKNPQLRKENWVIVGDTLFHSSFILLNITTCGVGPLLRLAFHSFSFHS
jgi:hypothetical protein